MSLYKPYPLYKDSAVAWLGNVPAHWSVGRLANSFQERRTKVSDKDFPALSVTKKGVVPQLENVAKTDDGDNRKLVKKGDVAINSRSDRKGSSGLVDRDGSVSLIITVIEPAPEVLGDFIHHLIRSEVFQEEYFRVGNGLVADLWTTNYSSMRGIVLALPSMKEQKFVADFLDLETARIDALIEKKTRFIELLREKRKAIITQAVTKGLNPNVPMKGSGIEWLGDVPEHWVVCKLSFRYSTELGKMLDEKRITGSHLVPYLRNQDVQWGNINTDALPEMDILPEQIDRYTVNEGDLLVCEGGDVGRAAIWRGPDRIFGYQKALHRLRARFENQDVAEFLYFSIVAAKENGAFDENDSKATISHLPAEKFKQYRFVFPLVSEQIEIAQYLSKRTSQIDALVEKIEQSIELLKEHRSTLITAAVTGQIDLREAA